MCKLTLIVVLGHIHFGLKLINNGMANDGVVTHDHNEEEEEVTYVDDQKEEQFEPRVEQPSIQGPNTIDSSVSPPPSIPIHSATHDDDATDYQQLLQMIKSHSLDHLLDTIPPAEAMCFMDQDHIRTGALPQKLLVGSDTEHDNPIYACMYLARRGYHKVKFYLESHDSAPGGPSDCGCQWSEAYPSFQECDKIHGYGRLAQIGTKVTSPSYAYGQVVFHCFRTREKCGTERD